MSFLVFEGIDASGKSTLLNLLCEKFKEEGLSFVQTREPGGTRIGEKIRSVLLEKQNTAFHPLAEALLYYSDRKQHIEELIQPALKKGLWILSDRYWASTSAYQCGGRGLDEGFVENLKQTVCAGYEPDLWFLLDLPVEEALKRLSVSKKDSRDRFEKEDKTFHQKVRAYYLQLAKTDPLRWLVLDARNPLENLLKQVLSHLEQKIGLKLFL